MEREIVFCLCCCCCCWKKEKDFFCCVSRTVGFFRDGTRRPERIIMSGDARLSLSLIIIFLFFKKMD
jgi:hypothetical protein